MGKLLTTAEIEEMKNVQFRSMSGLLLVLATRTWPDIDIAVSILANSQSTPEFKNWKMVKHVVLYLISTRDICIFLPNGSGKVDLKAWSDVDWASDHSNRHSRSGFFLAINGSAVVLSSMFQSATALSTSEAEFRALRECV